jgi:hypothetical protein
MATGCCHFLSTSVHAAVGVAASVVSSTARSSCTVITCYHRVQATCSEEGEGGPSPPCVRCSCTLHVSSCTMHSQAGLHHAPYLYATQLLSHGTSWQQLGFAVYATVLVCSRLAPVLCVCPTSTGQAQAWNALEVRPWSTMSKQLLCAGIRYRQHCTSSTTRSLAHHIRSLWTPTSSIFPSATRCAVL